MRWELIAILVGICLIPSLPARPLPPLPEPAFVDGEVSRCYPFDQSGFGSIWIDLSASFTGTASNNLEIAFGQDADRDGELSLPETDLILGWSCGRYFLERFKTGEVYEETNGGTNDIARSLGWNSRVRRNGQIVSLSLTNECGAAFTDVLSSPPSWLYDTRWNRMRITARGDTAREAAFNLDMSSRGRHRDRYSIARGRLSFLFCRKPGICRIPLIIISGIPARHRPPPVSKGERKDHFAFTSGLHGENLYAIFHLASMV